MKSSIKRFLLLNLLISITITASLTAVGNYFLDNAEIQRHLDTHLQQTARFLDAIIVNDPSILIRSHKIQNIINTTDMMQNQFPTQKKPNDVHDEFQFQVWSKHNHLLLHSKKSPKNPFSVIQNGFNTTHLNDKDWRVYTHYNNQLKMRISVAEPCNFRQRLEQRITWDNLLVLLWTYPLLGLLIWITVGKSLNSIKKISKELSDRDASDFSSIHSQNIPNEIQPLINELNALFSRLQEEFQRNKRFASDAAHELRTPLAALRTQTQVALITTDEKERKEVLKDIIKCVDRSAHVVQQLLILSRLGNSRAMHDLHVVDLSIITADTIAQIAPQALEKNIDIELTESKPHITINGNETSLSILIRNIVDNAIRYTPQDGSVKIHIDGSRNKVILSVSDSGPGIPKELRSRVFERFYRGLGTTEQGSGLGLAIVEQIAHIHYATIKLKKSPQQKGLQIDIIFPKKINELS